MTPEQIKEKALFIRSVEFIKTEYPDLPDALKLTISLYCAKFAKKEIEAAQIEAWNAARVTKSYHMVDNEEYAVHGSILKYRTFEQWNEANK
jgi:hypothetical protein